MAAANAFLPNLHEFSLQPLFEDAQYTGCLNLAGQGLTEFPGVVAVKYGICETYFADISCNRFACLPNAILDMLSLESLLASNNNIISLPTSIAWLSNLTFLDLRCNRLSSFPKTLARLPLQVLLLGCNSIAEIPSPDIAYLKDTLTELDLSSNRLTFLPAEMGCLHKLRVLAVRQNFLTSLPSDICSLVELIELDLSSNSLCELPLEMRQMKALISLNLSGNPLSVPPATVAKFGVLYVFKALEVAENAKQKNKLPFVIHSPMASRKAMMAIHVEAANVGASLAEHPSSLSKSQENSIDASWLQQTTRRVEENLQARRNTLPLLSDSHSAAVTNGSIVADVDVDVSLISSAKQNGHVCVDMCLPDDIVYAENHQQAVKTDAMQIESQTTLPNDVLLKQSVEFETRASVDMLEAASLSVQSDIVEPSHEECLSKSKVRERIHRFEAQVASSSAYARKPMTSKQHGSTAAVMRKTAALKVQPIANGSILVKNRTDKTSTLQHEKNGVQRRGPGQTMKAERTANWSQAAVGPVTSKLHARTNGCSQLPIVPRKPLYPPSQRNHALPDIEASTVAKSNGLLHGVSPAVTCVAPQHSLSEQIFAIFGLCLFLTSLVVALCFSD